MPGLSTPVRRKIRPAGKRARSCYGTAMARPLPVVAFALTLALPLGACAGAGRTYPSLERRAAEREYGSAAPATGAPAVPLVSLAPPSADLTTRLAALRGSAARAHQAFESRQPGTARMVAAAQGAARASENWSVAQVALAELESVRSQGMIALADLDSLLIDKAVANAYAPTADLAAVEAVHAEVSGWIAREDEVLGALRSRLR